MDINIYTVPDPHTHDVKLDSLKKSVTFTFIILQNLIGTNHRESG